MTLNHLNVQTFTGASLPMQDLLAIRQLSEQLSILGLPDLLATYTSARQRLDTLRTDLPLLPQYLHTLVTFFILGDPVERAALEELLSSEVINMLQRRNLAHLADNSFSLNNLRLVHHLGVLIFCERPHAAMKCYYGDDSLGLGRLLLPARGRVLDLCAGVGTQGLLCALTAEQVIAVEQEPVTAPLFMVNAALNGVEDKTELRLGNLLDPVRGERFDRVCTNPPFIPIPRDLPYPPTGNGGPDGLAVTKQILEALPDLLTPQGKCQIIGMLLGNETTADLSPFEHLAELYRLDMHLTLPSRMSLEASSEYLTKLGYFVSMYSEIDVQTACQTLFADLSARGATHIYSFLMVASLAPIHRPGCVTRTSHYLRENSLWSV